MTAATVRESPALQLASLSLNEPSLQRRQQLVREATINAPPADENNDGGTINGSSSGGSSRNSASATNNNDAANVDPNLNGSPPVKKSTKPVETIFDADFTVYARDALHYGENFCFDKTYNNIPTRNFGKLTWRVQCTRNWAKQNGVELTLSLLENDNGESPAAAMLLGTPSSAGGITAPLKINVRIELEQIVPDYCYNERLKVNYIFTPGECMSLGPLKLISEAEIEALHNADFSRFKSPQSWECPKCHQWQESVKCNDCYAESVYYCYFCREGRSFVSSPHNSSAASSRNSGSKSSASSLLTALENGGDTDLLSDDDDHRIRSRHHRGMTRGRSSACGEQQHAQRCPECNAFCINSLRFTFLNPHGNLRCWIKVDGEKQQLIEPNIVVTRTTPEIANVQTWVSRDTEMMRGLADCFVVAEGRRIPGHMAIMASRSRYFQTIVVEHYKKASTSSSSPLIWSLPCSVAVAEMLMFHLYTDEMPDVPNNTLTYELMRMADLYQLTRLKNQCEAALYQTINRTNLCEVLLAADIANADQLRDYAVNYCQWNLKYAMQSPEWQDLCYPEHCHLIEMITTGKRPAHMRTSASNVNAMKEQNSEAHQQPCTSNHNRPRQAAQRHKHKNRN